MRKFIYSLKLHSGQLLHSEGYDPEDAARNAGVHLDEVKRHMPVRKILTDAEREAQEKRFATLRQKSVTDDTGIDLALEHDEKS